MNTIKITYNSVEIRHLEVIPASESWNDIEEIEVSSIETFKKSAIMAQNESGVVFKAENRRFRKGDVWYVNATQDCDAVSQANAILAHETGTAFVGEPPKQVYKYTKKFGGDTQEELFGAVAEYHVVYPSTFYITTKSGKPFKSESAAKAATTKAVNAGKIEFGAKPIAVEEGGYVSAIYPSDRCDVRLSDKENHIKQQEKLAAIEAESAIALEQQKYVDASAATLELCEELFEVPKLRCSTTPKRYSGTYASERTARQGVYATTVERRLILKNQEETPIETPVHERFAVSLRFSRKFNEYDCHFNVRTGTLSPFSDRIADKITKQAQDQILSDFDDNKTASKIKKVILPLNTVAGKVKARLIFPDFDVNNMPSEFRYDNSLSIIGSISFWVYGINCEYGHVIKSGGKVHCGKEVSKWDYPVEPIQTFQTWKGDLGKRGCVKSTKFSSSNIIPLVAPATYGHTKLELFQSKTGVIEPEETPKLTSTFHAAVAAHASMELGLDATPINICKSFGNVKVETGIIYQVGDAILSPILVGDHNPYWDNGVPNFELAKAQINMSITGAKLCYLAVARGYDNLEIIPITWDDSGVEYIEQLKAFNADYVLRGVQPPLSGNTRVDAIDTSRYQQNDKVVECSNAVELAQQYEEAAENSKAASDKLKNVKNEIFHALSGASTLLSPLGDNIINIEVNKRGARKIVTHIPKEKEKVKVKAVAVNRAEVESKARKALNNLDALLGYSATNTVVINLSSKDDIEYFKLRFRGARYVSWDDAKSPGNIDLVRFTTGGI